MCVDTTTLRFPGIDNMYGICKPAPLSPEETTKSPILTYYLVSLPLE